MARTESVSNPRSRRGTTGVIARALAWLSEHSLATKFLFLTVGGQLILFAALTSHNASLLEGSIEEPFKLRVESLKPLFNSALAPLLVARDYAALADRLRETRSDDDIQYLVVRNADDLVVASAGWNAETPMPLASRNALDSDEVYDTFMLIENEGKKYGTLNFGISTKKLLSYRDDMRDRDFAIVATGMLLLGLVQGLLAVHLTRRLREVSAAGEEVALGRFDLRLDDSGRDEVARLATSMNTMSRAIKEKIRNLEDSEERLRLAMDAGAVVPWERDLDAGTLHWGVGVERLLGPRPAAGRAYPDLLDMVHPVDKSALLAARADAVHANSDYSCDFRITRTDGTEGWLAVRGRFMPRPGSVSGYLLGVMRDITAGKTAELEINRLNQQLEQRVAERTAELQAAIRELEAFSHTIWHDLRAPLRAMAAYPRLVKEELAAAHESGQAVIYLDLISNNAGRMSQMLDDLLQFSKASRTPINRRKVNPDEIVAGLLEDLHFPEQNRARIIMAPMPACNADPALLRQVYANLLSNALKYSSRSNAPVVEIGSTLDAANEVTYFVRDNGAGFDMDHAKNLFGVFQRLHNDKDFEGTGVGLSIVHRIVSRHGGRIWADAAPGRGATFSFTIPAA